MAKIDPQGVWQWATQAGGINGCTATSIAVDASGYIYITGTYQGYCAFGDFSLFANGTQNVFVATLDNAGNWLWAISAGGTSNDKAQAIAMDSEANAYITGSFENNASFGSIAISEPGDRNMYVAKIDTQGVWQWVQQTSSTYSVNGFALAVNSEFQIYVTGSFWINGIFGSLGVYTGIDENLFVAKLSSAGQWLWATGGGGTGSDLGYALCLDRDENPVVAGHFNNTGLFGSWSLSSAGYTDIVVAKLSSNGSWSWAFRAGAPTPDVAYGISMDQYGTFYLAGYIDQPGADFGEHTSTGSWVDLFLARLGETPPLAPENLSIINSAEGIELSWDHVTENSDGIVVTISLYKIFYQQTSDPEGAYQYLGSTNSTSFTHIGADSDKGFYRITAIAD